MLWLFVANTYDVAKVVEFPGLVYTRITYDPKSPFSFEDLLREPGGNVIDACPSCGPCPVGCGGVNPSGECDLSHAHQDCWSGTCIIVCVYSCSECRSRGEDETIPNSSGKCSSSLSVQENLQKSRYNGPVVVFDVAGRVVWRGTWRGRIPNLPKGVYVVRSPDGSFTKRVVVR